MSDAKIIVVVVVLGVIVLGGGIYYVTRPDPPPTPPQAAVPVKVGAATVAPVTDKSEPVASVAREAVVVTPRVQPTPQPPAPPPPPPPLPQNPGKITGNVWLTKNDGTSNLMRGMNVAVIEPTVDGAEVVEKLKKAPAEWKDLADRYRQLAANARKHAKEFGDHDGHWAKSAKESEEGAKIDDAKATSIEAFMRNAPKKIDALKAYAVLKDASMNGLVSFPPKVVKETRTKVDGKFAFSDVPPGDYYLWGFFGSETNWVEWVVPVAVTPGGELEVDLFNDNAVNIKNMN